MTVRPELPEIVDCLYRVAVKAVIVQNGKILLVRDEPGDKWGFPGGGVDYGESIESALKRELTEELGIHDESSMDIVTNMPSILIGHIKDGIPRCNLHYKVEVMEPIQMVDSQNERDVVEIMWVPISDMELCEFDSAAGTKEDIQNLIHTLAA
jgi:8-oxo-dGTP pyrophosphatase MutT (NUDIX family)